MRVVKAEKDLKRGVFCFVPFLLSFSVWFLFQRKRCYNFSISTSALLDFTKVLPGLAQMAFYRQAYRILIGQRAKSSLEVKGILMACS